MLLVLLDNASAEYNFILRFFQEDQMPPLPTPRTPLTPLTPAFGDDTRTDVGSEFGAQSQQGGSYISSADLARSRSVEGAELSMLGGLWKQVMEPAIQFCQVGYSPCHPAFFLSECMLCRHLQTRRWNLLHHPLFPCSP